MSRARELALIEKWTDVAGTTSSFPPLASPTSPKATKFCCCPNRRRYNLKHPKAKSTLDARNIFLDNDFTYIDADAADDADDDDGDAEQGDNGKSKNSQRNYNSNNGYGRYGTYSDEDKSNGSRSDFANGVAINSSSSNSSSRGNNQRKIKRWQRLQKPTERQQKLQPQKQQLQREEQLANVRANDADDYDDIGDVVDGAGNCEVRSMNAQQQQRQQENKVVLEKLGHKADQQQQQWRPDKSCHNEGNNSNTNGATTTNEKSSNDCVSNSCDSQNRTKANGNGQSCNKGNNNNNNTQIECDCGPNLAATTTPTTNKSDKVVAIADEGDFAVKQWQLQQQQYQQHTATNVESENNNKYNSNNNNNNSDQETIQRLRVSEFKHSGSNFKGQAQQQQIDLRKHSNNNNKNSECNQSSELSEHVNYQQLDSSTTPQTTATTSNKKTITKTKRTPGKGTSDTSRITNIQQQKQSQNTSNKNDCICDCDWDCEYDDKDDNDDSDGGDDNKIDLQNKMTITTTNAACRKHSRVECGLTLPTTETLATATATTTAATAGEGAAHTNAEATINASTTEIAPNSARITTDMAGNTAMATTTTRATASSATAAAAAAAAATTTTGTGNGAMELRSNATSPIPTPSSRPTTPSLTTVIKTTMVKRTPSTESKSSAPLPLQLQATATTSKTPSPTTTPTTPTTKTIVTATVTARAYSNSVGRGRGGAAVERATERAESTDNGVEEAQVTGEQASASRTSVKQRIAAFAAGNEQQMRSHDSSIKAQQNKGNNINNKHSSNKNMTTTNEAKSNAINSEHYKASSASTSTGSVISDNGIKCATKDETEASTTTATQSATATVPSQTAAAATSVTMTTTTAAPTTTTSRMSSNVSNTGYATMPRRSPNSHSSGSIGNAKCGSGSNSNSSSGRASKHNSNLAVTADNGNGGATSDGAAAAVAAADNCRKLAATLDNLDLALVRDLTDDDGEDSYAAFQEYLERVEHEINEVFEQRRARQRAQQMLEAENATTANPNAPAAVINNSHNTNKSNREASSESSVNRLSQCDVFDASASSSSPAFTGNNMADITPRCRRRTTELKALPPPPLSPPINGVHALDQHENFASVADVNASDTNPSATQEDVNIWANKFLRDLDNLMSSTRPLSLSACSSPTSKTSPQLLSAAASAAIQSRYGRGGAAERSENGCTANGLVVLRPEKHATIPLQSFNLDCGRLENGGINADNINNNSNNSNGSNNVGSSAPTTTTSVAYMRTLSAPTPHHLQQQQQQLLHELVGKSQTSNNGGVVGKGNRNSLATFNATTEQHQHYHNLTNLQCDDDGNHHGNANVTMATTSALAMAAKTSTPTTATTILKIEETAATTTTAKPTTTTATSGSRRLAMAMTTLNVSGGGVVVAAAAEETDEESLKSRRQRQIENDMETIRAGTTTTATTTKADTYWTPREQQQLANGDKGGGGGGNSSHISGDGLSSSNGLSALLAIPKRERINPATMTTKLGNSTAVTSSAAAAKPNGGGAATTATTNTAAAASALLLNGNDVTKKGSTSTIWTSEESILRSVGAVDEDNNSTSSSACEEASGGALSSGKSGISLDSSGLDNENNESGIGTATPPKDTYWKHNQHNDNESVSSLDALRKMKFQKSNSVGSSDDPDLLEVLSLCGDESHDDIDEQRQPQQRPPTAARTAGGETTDKQKQETQLQQQQHQLLRAARQRHRQRPPHQQQQQQRARQDDSDNLANSNDALETTTTTVPVGGGVVDVRGLADEYDEGHDEFEPLNPYYDCECNDGDASSASGSGISGGGSVGSAGSGSGGSGSGGSGHIGGGGGGSSTAVAANDSIGSVVLRRKLSLVPTTTTTQIMIPCSGFGGCGGRAQKCRSHSLDTCSLPTAVYYQYSPAALHHHHHHAQLQHHHPQQHHPLTRKLQQHLHGRGGRERGQLSLALRQEPFQSLLSPTHFAELPSPSSASLHSGHESLGIQELTTKSNSAPLLLKQEKTRRDDFAGQKLTLRYSRSQSDRYLAEIEAVEACKWLRAAGFPQYAQMYEDHQFPLDLTNVAKDHTNLENDQLQSLYRRLCILNRCANMRLDQSHKPQTPQQKEDSDDENCALSENWTFQPHIRRWSRIGEMGLELPPAGKLNIEKTESSSKESSPDRFEDDSYDVTGGGLSLTLPGHSTDTNNLNEAADSSAVRLRRTGSERFKDGAKAFLRRVESIKSRRRKRQNREGIVISGPQALHLSHLGQRNSMRKPDAVYSTPPSPSAVSPVHTFPKGPLFGNELKVPSQSETFLSPNRASPKRTPTTPRSMRASPLHFFTNPMPHLKEGKSDDSSSYYSDSQESSAGGKLSLRKTPSKTRRFLQRTGKVDDIGAHSDSECHHGRKLLIKDANSNTTEIKVKKLTRGGSLNLGKDGRKRDGVRSASFRSRSTSRKEPKPEETDNIKRTPVVRWHSFQMEERPQMIFRKCFSQKGDPTMNDLGIPFAAMSAGQLHILRKLALVILTGYMERYCPTHRSGWNWELPKFIKKIKMPDYKDKKVFGVPLLLVLQRTGQTLPIAIRAAFRWLQLRALDQIGLFRKSGVKSRIIKLKSEVEQLDSTALCMEMYDTQQAYDVADMLKQYFRDLPESLLTTKMSETFAAIFQHLPKDVRLEAVQSAVLLLPDENREILYALLEFLTLVSANAEQNQMTTNNLAVCLAPSLFHSSISTGAASVAASPRRRGKGTGVPDEKELQEAKASHECLAFMIDNYKRIFTANKEKISKCNFGYMEESKPVPLEALGEGMQFHNWRGYLYECTSATIKEGREKTRGWFTISSQNDSNVDIAYKKVGDGHPLRLWRCTTEVEGPPREVLDYIIKQRASWDVNLLESQTVKKLDERTEIFQYAIDGQFTTDFCVLRSWQTDLPRGACVIVETSIDHVKARPMFGAIRGVVLASRYLIEPCGSGRSRVMHLARVDVKGRTPEWYNKSYGHICSHYLSKIRLAFKHVAEGPESKV